AEVGPSAGLGWLRSPPDGAERGAWWGELPENWTDTRETILEGMTFNLRHLGMTLVDQPKGEELSASAVKRIVATAKASGKKPQKVSLKVCPQGIVLYDRPTNQLLEKVSIYRISYCTVDKLHSKVFAYITQNALNGTLECHAYLCSKRREAQAVALTVAQAFTVAFELWQVAREGEQTHCHTFTAGLHVFLRLLRGSLSSGGFWVNDCGLPQRCITSSWCDQTSTCGIRNHCLENGFKVSNEMT
uniref:Low density lipoprotein receptor adaptor protein 1a n=1 Tax=Oryzias latipes TaxID=8090 RepID=A0A3P9HI29_ORYLA